MLVNRDQSIDTTYINELEKRFGNFCKKAPIPLSFKITKHVIHVHEFINNEVKPFDFTGEPNVKIVVKRIKDWLCQHKYPVMVQTSIVEKPYSPAEYVDMVNKGEIKYEEIHITKKVVEDSIRWRIEKVFVNRDEFIVRNIEEGKVYRFKLRMPCILFLRKMRENKLNSFDAWQLFSKRSDNLGECQEVDENNELIEK